MLGAVVAVSFGLVVIAVSLDLTYYVRLIVHLVYSPCVVSVVVVAVVVSHSLLKLL